MPLVTALVDASKLAGKTRGQANDSAALVKTKGGEVRQPQEVSGPDITVSPTGIGIRVKSVLLLLIELGDGLLGMVGQPGVFVPRSVRRQFRRVRSKGLKGVKSREAAMF